MEYANHVRLRGRPSRLGFGCMRFPKTPEGEIDEPKALHMLDEAYKAGVNYFDTAYLYHDGKGEAFVGRALSAYPRDSFYLATKLPPAAFDSKEKALGVFEEQLGRLGVSYFDFYLLHSLNGERWEMLLREGILDTMIELKKQGRIHRLGFSFHDSYAVFERVLTHHDWDFCQIQLNYMDVDEQAGLKGYALAERLGIPVIVMEPVRGGGLAALPEDIEAVFRSVRPEWSIASWALRWVASLPNCAVILSGMSTSEQVQDNLSTFAALEPFGEREQQAVEQVRRKIEALSFVSCTNCRYCMPCPAGVDIPENFSAFNEEARYGDERRMIMRLGALPEQARAERCVRCGQCESLCPQGIPIREKLQAVAQRWAGRAG